MNDEQVAESPSWLMAAIDQRLAFMKQETGQVDFGAEGFGFVVTPLTEPDGDETWKHDMWERTCDNCGAYCPDPIVFYTGHAVRMHQGTQVLVTFGMCQKCKDLP